MVNPNVLLITVRPRRGDASGDFLNNNNANKKHFDRGYRVLRVNSFSRNEIGPFGGKNWAQWNPFLKSIIFAVAKLTDTGDTGSWECARTDGRNYEKTISENPLPRMESIREGRWGNSHGCRCGRRRGDDKTAGLCWGNAAGDMTVANFTKHKRFDGKCLRAESLFWTRGGCRVVDFGKYPPVGDMSRGRGRGRPVYYMVFRPSYLTVYRYVLLIPFSPCWGNAAEDGVDSISTKNGDGDNLHSVFCATSPFREAKSTDLRAKSP